ncbi:hypothetical protein Leryth_016674 [Lithospermum erythrorhizon]|nr:hypothetical protein Leryth_016674 [Lithospermum erythrorhizon]
MSIGLWMKAWKRLEYRRMLLCCVGYSRRVGLRTARAGISAPFIEEEWDGDAALFIPGGEIEEDLANGDEIGVGGNDAEQENIHMSKTPLRSEKPTESHNFAIVCKRERSEEPEPLSLSQHKKSKHDDPSSSNANGSEDSITAAHDPPQMMMTKNFPSAHLLEFPLLAPAEPKENQTASQLTFDSSNLEKAVPPGYLKFISNLENEILNISMERETLKIEVMRSQAMISILQSRMDMLGKENENLKRVVHGGRCKISIEHVTIRKEESKSEAFDQPTSG